VENNSNNKQHWTVCAVCKGEGRVLKEPSLKRRKLFQFALSEYERGEGVGNAPVSLAGSMQLCANCSATGLQPAENEVIADGTKYPTLAIVGGGIGGVALAVACLHRGIPFTLYERDQSFSARSQGYGLTLQQASKAIEGLGVISLSNGVVSTRHVVHNPDGKVIGEWGLRRWKREYIEHTSRRRNVHISRQTLRQSLLEQLHDSQSVRWGHTLLNIHTNEDGTANLIFKVGGKQECVTADVVVGADGIRSRVREVTIGEDVAPLKYLDCFVMLGICPLASLSDVASPLLDSATIFQTVNGHERMYMMPYDKDTIMWQFSFPMSATDAKELSALDVEAMKAEALKRIASWHSPVPQVVAATLVANITGYPVYDRALFDPTILNEKGNVTLLGDAAHPMSPFKGQGANQALLDALTLARKIFAVCNEEPPWREKSIRASILQEYEHEMARRSAVKVKSSAVAAHLLHSPAVLHEGDEPRGQRLWKENEQCLGEDSQTTSRTLNRIKKCDIESYQKSAK